MGLNGFFPFLEKPFQVEKSILLILRKNVKIQSGQKGQSVFSIDTVHILFLPFHFTLICSLGHEEIAELNHPAHTCAVAESSYKNSTHQGIYLFGT